MRRLAAATVLARWLTGCSSSASGGGYTITAPSPRRRPLRGSQVQLMGANVATVEDVSVDGEVIGSSCRCRRTCPCRPTVRAPSSRSPSSASATSCCSRRGSGRRPPTRTAPTIPSSARSCRSSRRGPRGVHRAGPCRRPRCRQQALSASADASRARRRANRALQAAPTDRSPRRRGRRLMAVAEDLAAHLHARTQGDSSSGSCRRLRLRHASWPRSASRSPVPQRDRAADVGGAKLLLSSSTSRCPRTSPRSPTSTHPACERRQPSQSSRRWPATPDGRQPGTPSGPLLRIRVNMSPAAPRR